MSVRTIRGRAGLTLIEALIVIIILGMVATLVVPRFTDASIGVKEDSLKTNLQTIRSQIQLYTLQHGDQYPSAPAGGCGPYAPNTFEAQMTMATTLDGSTGPVGAEGYPFGPYLQSIPNNPFTGTNTVGTGDAQTGETAWCYEGPATGMFRANHAGTDRDGAAYTTY